MKYYNTRNKVIFYSILFLLLAGCAQKAPIKTEIPLPEKSVIDEQAKIEKEAANGAILQAEKDISEARDAGAEKYANEMLGNAESMLSGAKNAFNMEDYLKAKEDAQESSNLAKEAKSLTLEKIKGEKKQLSEENKARLERERLSAEQERKRLEIEKAEKENAERLAAEKLAREEEKARLASERKKTKNLLIGIILVVVVVVIALIVTSSRKRKPINFNP